MDIKEDDISDESMKNHMRYYRSLCKTISDINEEKNKESEPAIKNHLDSRIEAMEKDKKKNQRHVPRDKRG